MAMKEKFKNLLQLSMLQAAEIKEINAGDMAELQKKHMARVSRFTEL